MKILSLLFVTSFLLSCEYDPYPNNGSIEPNPRRETMPPRAAIGTNILKQYKLTEGRETFIKWKATVPAPGVPELTILGLPSGATFDKKTMEFKWTPGYFDGNDPLNPSISIRTYNMTILVRSSLNNIKAEEYEVQLTVEDNPQKFEIVGDDSDHVYEGSKLDYRFNIDNFDYPQGGEDGFSVTADNLPPGMEIKKLSATHYKITGTPDYHDVILSEPDNCNTWRQNCKEYNIKLTAVNPANHITTKEVKLEIRDERLAPKLVIPEAIEQGLDSSFQISAYDLNADVAPEIKISPDSMPYGDFKVTPLKDEETKSSVLNVTWSDIPPSYNGKTKTFDLEACVYDRYKDYDNCVKGTFDLKIVVKNRKPPVITRSSWPIGNIEYFKNNESKDFALTAKDGNNGETITDIEILPKEMTKYVSYSNGEISVKMDEPGIHQFTVKATSAYNIEAAESFVLEVFKKDRSKNLYFTDSTRGKEVTFYKDVLKDVTIMNPILQALNERNLSGRDTLIIGTDILLDKGMRKKINRAMGKIPNVLVATSKIENMPSRFLRELQKDHHISFLGRYKDLNIRHKLKDLHFIARDDFEQGLGKVRLKGDSTTESSNPMIFSVGVDRVGCDDVLDLTDKKDEERLKVGIICDRKGGGRYAILGTEFSDLKASFVDRNIATKWLRRMLTTKLNGVVE